MRTEPEARAALQQAMWRARAAAEQEELMMFVHRRDQRQRAFLADLATAGVADDVVALHRRFAAQTAEDYAEQALRFHALHESLRDTFDALE